MELKICGPLCATETFKVNGINADSNDFGEQDDQDSENAEDYGCGDMRFERNAATKDVLEKYKITSEEYGEIAEKLEDGLSFGCCGWCI